ncbi:MAG: hypothetical protein WD035_07080 [Balneolaceae bacterium]
MKSLKKYLLFALALILFNNCGTTDTRQEEDAVYPMYLDENNNGINDYVEPSTHDAGLMVSSKSIESQLLQDQYFGQRGHNFIDQNEDGICDYAQNGSPTWHGPGFVDDNNNGICDYWDSSLDMHRRHEGMRYLDENGNHINDYFEEGTHLGPGHNFVDQNGDGICDYAQDGRPTWHGPGFTDGNNNGMSDHWEQGGRGHGRSHGMRNGPN